MLTMKGEWPPVDQLLKVIEKAVTAAAAAAPDDPAPSPLAAISDPVSNAADTKEFFRTT